MHHRTLDRRMPPRTPGPHPGLEPGPSAADPARVRDPPQSAPAAPVTELRCAAQTPTRTGRSRPVVADALGYHQVTTAKLAAQAGDPGAGTPPESHLRSPSG